jgi:AcrR family transcriptional regulator
MNSRISPVQDRSRQRLEDIVRITASLVEDLGPAEVTTTLIADRLGISVGSIYTYFKDRLAIFDAIVSRAIANNYEVSMRTRAEVTPDGPRTPDEWFTASFAVIDRLADAYRCQAGFRKLWFSQFLSSSMLESMQRSDDEQARKLLSDLEAAGHTLDCPSPLDAMRVYVGLIDKGLDLAFRHDPQGREELIAETKHVVFSYLGPYMRQGPEARQRNLR